MTHGQARGTLPFGLLDSKEKKFNNLLKTARSNLLEDYAKSNKKSWKCDKYCLEAHLKPYFGNMRLLDISPILIENYRVERLASGIQKSTANRELALLKKMFNLAIDWELAAVNPVLKVRLFSEKDNLKERILAEEEESRLLVQCAPHLRHIVIAALNTGARKNELVDLKWCNVELKQRTLLLTKTKSGKNRMIPINGLLLEVLKARKAESKSEYVFKGPGDEHITTIRKAFGNACRRAGIRGLRFHDLRHTFGTRLIRKGVDIVTVQQLLGHYSITVTQRYTHTDGEQKREAVELLWDKAVKNPGNLSHIWHTERAMGQQVQTIPLFSVN